MSVIVIPAIRRFDALGREDVPWAGGKGANLGELARAGFPVPPGFVVGAPAYAAMCEAGGLRARIAARLRDVDVDAPDDLAQAAADVKAMVRDEPVPEDLDAAILAAHDELVGDEADAPVAVRSSATAEDTATASFAGMNETFLNVRGAAATLDAVRRCWASLFGARTIAYRATQGLPQAEMDIAVVVQRQVEAVRAGVMFTVDPASGRRDRIVIEGAFGFGESVVSGSVSPDRYVVDADALTVVDRLVREKAIAVEAAAGGGTVTRSLGRDEAARPVLSDAEAVALARIGLRIQDHYGAPQDTEWAFDPAGIPWILQARPVTATGGEPSASTAAGEALARGLGAAPGVGVGPARVLEGLPDASRFRDGDVLVTHMTAPDWVPLMRRAVGIVTETGGMTCHAAIVSRELGVPCVVGASGATTVLRDGEVVTVDAGQGVVRAGALPAAAPAGSVTETAPSVAPPTTATRLLVNLSEPSQVARAAALPVEGVGLLRAELMLLEALDGVHPRLLMERGKSGEVVDRLAGALGTFATGFAPRPVTYRTIDFRTNEFRGLEGGERFEPLEANPMIGYRGASRYVREPELLRLELDALVRVWDAGGTNLHAMLPFVRTPRELEACLRLFDDAGLRRRAGFELWIMAEVPSVLFHLERYAALGIAGISIGSNDLTQLLLGVDRDSDVLAAEFDERDEAVVAYLRELIPRARSLGLATSICGQAPSVHPEYAEILVRAGIDAMSVSVDAVDATRRLVAAAEQRILLEVARRG